MRKWIPHSRKKIYHELGIQANPLLRQLINLNSGNATTVTNPYLMSYSLTFTKCKLSLDAGVGYSYQSFQDKNSPSNHISRINDVFYGVGFGKKCHIGKRFEAECAIDFAGSNQNDKTFSLSVTSFGGGNSDSTSTTTSTVSGSIGSGLRGNLNFNISRRIFIGTEANYYLQFTSNKQHVFVKDVITSGSFVQVTSTNTNTDTSFTKFSLTLPAVLFLIIKF